MVKFVVASAYTAELLEPIEEALDQIARLGAMPVDVSRNQAMPARGLLSDFLCA